MGPAARGVLVAIKPLRPGNRGVAIMITIFAIMLMTFVAVEISYETSVEYRVSNSDYHKVRAYYAAKSGVELALLRIQLFKNIMNQFGENLKGQTELLNKIWAFPFQWPPFIPKDLSLTNSEAITESVGESLMGSSYDVRIESEGSKIDINDLDSPSKVLRESTRKLIGQLIQNRIDEDDDWNENLETDELLNDITDWIDADDKALNGGDEKNNYEEFGVDSEFYPPNRPFKTFQELHMVKGMTDEIFNLIFPYITVYGTKGISVNLAKKEVLMSIHPTFTAEIVDEIIARIQDPDEGPFASMEEFKGFLGNRVNWKEIEDSGIPLYFGSEYNFRITSIGSYSKSRSEIIAIVYDFDTVKERLKEFMDKEDQQGGTPTPTPTATPGGNSGNSAAKSKPPLSGKPKIVYWQEE